MAKRGVPAKPNKPPPRGHAAGRSSHPTRVEPLANLYDFDTDRTDFVKPTEKSSRTETPATDLRDATLPPVIIEPNREVEALFQRSSSIITRLDALQQPVLKEVSELLRTLGQVHGASAEEQKRAVAYVNSILVRLGVHVVWPPEMTQPSVPVYSSQRGDYGGRISLQSVDAGRTKAVVDWNDAPRRAAFVPRPKPR